MPVPTRMSLRTVPASPSSSARKLSTPCIVESPVARTTGGGLAAAPPPTVTVRRTRCLSTRSSIRQRPSIFARKRRVLIVTAFLNPMGEQILSPRGGAMHRRGLKSPIPQLSTTRTRATRPCATRRGTRISKRVAHEPVRTA